MEIIPRFEIPLDAPRRPLSPMTQPKGWVVHYVGATGMRQAPTDAQSRATWRNIQQGAFDDQDQGYIDIEYSFGFDPMGRIYEGRGWDFKSAANGSSTYNDHAWAMCYLGGPDTPLTPAAKASAIWLVREGARRAPSITYVKGHKDVYAAGTACPGAALYEYVPVLQANLHQDAPPPPPVWKVKPVYNPPIDLNDMVDSLAIPAARGGGAWVLLLDGRVYAMGRGTPRPTVGGPKGHSYWGSRQAAKLDPYQGGYVVTATTSETYHFPAP